MKKLLLSLSLACTLNAASAFEAVSPVENFAVTDFKSMEQLTSYFKTMKGKKWIKDSDTNCFDRAHVWSYELFKKYKIQSKKVIIHYSAKYMEELKGGWSWHVAPMVTLNGEEMVLDRMFMDKPVTKEAWLDFFTKFARQKLEYKRKDYLTKIGNIEWKINKIRRDDGKFWWKSISSYQKDIRKIEREMDSWGLNSKDTADFKCKPVTNIEEVDYPMLTYKDDKEKNRKAVEWCYVQEMSMYYLGLPELRMLNYGTSYDSKIPFRKDLENARKIGSNHQKFEFEFVGFSSIWKSIERTFEKPEKRFRSEFVTYERLTDKD